MTKTVVNIFGKEYHIEDLYKIAHNELADDIEFIDQVREFGSNNPDERQYTVYSWRFRKTMKLAGNAFVMVYVRYYPDVDRLGLYYKDNPQESVKYIKKKKKQFKKSDYIYRSDLSGECINPKKDWFKNENGPMPNDKEEYELVRDIFNGRKERLNIGEYFTMRIFGKKCMAYRNEEGVFEL